jgi:menaquinone-dependent protoporphyrinogen IX oxidase
MEDEMNTQVLVAYATKYGATAEIAEKIGDVLRQAGLPTDVLPVDRVGDLSTYKAVVLGGLHRPMAQRGGKVLEGQRDDTG